MGSQHIRRGVLANLISDKSKLNTICDFIIDHRDHQQHLFFVINDKKATSPTVVKVGVNVWCFFLLHSLDFTGSLLSIIEGKVIYIVRMIMQKIECVL